MTKYSFAELPRWATKVERIADAIVKQATNDLIVRASRTAPGTSRGGTIRPGFVPRDTGFLAASLQSSLNGSTALTGETSYLFVVGRMEAGDVADFGWTAEYARAVHYRGWLWVDDAAHAWPGIVAAAVTKAQSMVRG